ncbi:hypothetical protein GF354_00185 [Candidatus Peregrinibacteria bacterium]|nr:hypothetical protein [Candidatus Peregrinibacteria bacterium]
MILITAILIFILGTAVGSFLSVVLYRIRNRKKGIFLSRSICPHCDKTLKWIHLVPILSYVFLKGKCAFCNKRISIRYFLLELITGLTFLAVFLQWNFVDEVYSIVDPDITNYLVNWATFEYFIFYLILSVFLIAIFFYDILYKEIPDRLSIPAIAIAIAGGLTVGTPEPLDMLIGGCAIFGFFGLQYALSKGKWIGGGDLRMGALIGVILGLYKSLGALAIAYIGGTILLLPLIILKKIHKKSEVPFGPFLVIATFIMLFFGDEIISWYLSFLYA